jgi:myo-inositol-1(or 4)-monophosphatase
MHPMLNTAVKAARRAGAIINRASLDGGFDVQSKRANDFVTEIDKAAEAAIIGIIRQAYPEHAILAEESGEGAGGAKNEYTWVIDPLDGTTNFIHGFPQYCVSIGIRYRSKTNSSRDPRGAARSSTTGACASPSAPTCAMR